VQNIANKNKKQDPGSPGPIDTRDADINELCSEDDHSNAKVEFDYFDHLNIIFSSERKKGGGSLVIGCVKHTVSIGGIKDRTRKS
jgi:hypothetical protein